MNVCLIIDHIWLDLPYCSVYMHTPILYTNRLQCLRERIILGDPRAFHRISRSGKTLASAFWWPVRRLWAGPDDLTFCGETDNPHSAGECVEDRQATPIGL